jgi:hypothetical protein
MEDNRMTDKKTDPTALTDKALEMVMRDVIDSMCEYSLESGLTPSDSGFEIIDIFPAHKETTARKQHQTEATEMEDSEVIEFPNLHRATG